MNERVNESKSRMNERKKINVMVVNLTKELEKRMGLCHCLCLCLCLCLYLSPPPTVLVWNRRAHGERSNQTTQRARGRPNLMRSLPNWAPLLPLQFRSCGFSPSSRVPFVVEVGEWKRQVDALLLLLPLSSLNRVHRPSPIERPLNPCQVVHE